MTDLKSIIEAVEHVTGIPAETIISRNNHKAIAEARHLFVYVATCIYSYKLVEVAKYLDRRNHSTIRSSREKIDEWREIYDAINSQIVNIIKRLEWSVPDAILPKLAV